MISIIKGKIEKAKPGEHVCPKCGGKRWKTKVKNYIHECRKCGYIQ